MRYALVLLCLALPSMAQDYYAARRSAWLQKAESLKPDLQISNHKPKTLVELVADPNAFQGWRAKPMEGLDDVYEKSFKTQSGTVFDFGEHLTGKFTFQINALRGVSDAPLRFRLTFGEVPAELATSFDPFPGTLSRAWLQDEVITVMELPATVAVDRRVAFRYVRIELLGSSPYFDFAITGMQCQATTSVTSVPAALSSATPANIQEIDRVGLATLR